MECEMCGRTAAAKGKVEGVEMHLCTTCSRHATGVRSLQQEAKKAAPVHRMEQPKEELVEMVRPDFAKLLRQKREQLKLNQEQFAAKLQIRASTYNHYESGAATPDVTTARKIGQVIGTPLVVHMKMQKGTVQKQEGSVGLTLGDFVKKR